MDFKAAFFVKILTPAVLVAALSGPASAEVVKGTIKSVAKEAKVFTLQTYPESLFLILWDEKTAWQGIGNPAGIKPEEAVTVDYRQQGDQLVAAVISKPRFNVPPGIKAEKLETVAEILKSGEQGPSFVLVDTRPAELFDSAHIPYAISVPLSKLEKRAVGLLPEDKGARLVFSDEGQGGETASKSAELAVRAGHTNVHVLPEGAAGWVDSGRVLASSAKFIRKRKPVLIDLRNAGNVSSGHIEGAVNFPATELPEKQGDLPAGKNVPIVLYGESDSEAVAAAKMVRKWGYRKVTIFPGGASAWLNSAEVLESGPAGDRISSPSGHSGQLTPNDFDKALASQGMIEIVDARSPEELKKGEFPGTKKITLRDLPRRHGELDREQIQVVFASNPEEAEMAYDFLKSKGYRVNYLNGVVEFGQQGKYTVK